jgi:hypothetical protein
LADPAGSGATTDWAMGLFSDTDGPRAVIFHDGRLWYGGSRTSPNVFVGSRSDDYDNFDRGLSYGSTPTLGDDDYAIVKRVQGKNLQTIQWMASQGEYLVLGSSGGEFRTFLLDERWCPDPPYLRRSALDIPRVYPARARANRQPGTLHPS